MPVIPIDVLISEHRLIWRMLELIARNTWMTAEKRVLDTAFFDAATDFIRWYADKTHHAKEEAILFKEAAKKDLSPGDREMLEELVKDHEFGRQTVTQLIELKSRYLQGQQDSLDVIIERFSVLVDFYKQHIEKEDCTFFPASTKYFGDEEQAAMLREFWESDRKMMHLKYGGIVDQFEKLIRPDE